VLRAIIIGVVCVIVFSCFTAGCRTAVPNYGNPATEYQGISGEIREGQAELGITGAKIEERSRELEERSSELERSINAGAGTILEFRELLQQIRGQPITGATGEEREDSGPGTDTGER